MLWRGYGKATGGIVENLSPKNWSPITYNCFRPKVDMFGMANPWGGGLMTSSKKKASAVLAGTVRVIPEIEPSASTTTN
jgi:hypothetical protein